MPIGSTLRIAPLIERAVRYLGDEMDRGRLRRGDPGLVAALVYATLTGIATEPEVLRGVGWTATRPASVASATNSAPSSAPPSHRNDWLGLTTDRPRGD